VTSSFHFTLSFVVPDFDWQDVSHLAPISPHPEEISFSWFYFRPGHYFVSIARLFGCDVTAVQYAGSLYGLDIA
jgi:hypothetical protein